MSSEDKKKAVRLSAAAVFLTGHVLLKNVNRAASVICFVISYVLAGYEVILEALEGLKERNPLDENFLMSIASAGAICLGDLAEAAAVMLFYQIGEMFEDIAVERSRKNIAELIDIRPDYACVEREDGTAERTDPENVPLGAVIVVKPGEKIPIDGTVIEGGSFIDTAALTGESALRAAGPGDTVLSGCINMDGVLRLRTTRLFGQSTASKILDLVQNAGERKAKAEDFITRFARVYTPAVCISAAALAVIPPAARGMLGAEPAWGEWIYRALTFLVISCPCALVISIPLAFFGGLGGASRAGILVKGANFFEPLSKVKTAVFDKTGTVTEGVFEVSGVHHSTMEEKKLIEYAALAESFSNHPISISLQKAYGTEPDRNRVKDVDEISGKGVTALVDGHRTVCGNGALMEKEEIEYIPCSGPGTTVHVAVDGQYAGHILISDRIKSGAAQALKSIKEAGAEKTVMLTGDSETAALDAAAKAGVDEVYAQLLPDGKVEKLEELIAGNSSKGSVIFIGDGINDAPVLARADVGIAMGAIGSDAAIEAADVIIMDDDIGKAAKAVKIAGRTMKIVRENIWFAIGAKVVCLTLTALGVAGMWLAVFADVGVMIISVINALRALNAKKA